MASQLKKTVKPSGGDYTSLEACMNANEQDLTAADKYFDVEIDGTWSSADATPVLIHNYTTDSTRYINIYTTSTARHLGVYSSSCYRIEGTMGGSTAFAISSNYVTVTGLQMNQTYTGYGYGLNITDGVSYAVIDKCIVMAAGSVALRNWNNTSTGIIFKNTIAKTTKTDSHGIATLSGIQILNCIAVGNGNGSGISRSGGTPIVKNCYAASGAGVAYSASMTITTSASDDGSESTATVAYSTSSGAYFTNVTAGSEDFHIGALSALKDAGTDLSATFTDDIDGNTRPTGAGTWDIGADEYIAAGTTVSAPTFSLSFTLMSTSRTASGNVYPQPISLTSNLPSPSPQVSKIVSALSFSSAVISALSKVTAQPNPLAGTFVILSPTVVIPTVNVTVAPNAQSLSVVLNATTETGSANVYPQPQSMTLSLSSAEYKLMAAINALSLTLNAPIKNIKITIPAGALSGIFNLPSADVQILTGDITITPEVFILTLNLPDSREVVIYKFKSFATKHDQDIFTTRAKVNLNVAKANTTLNVAK